MYVRYWPEHKFYKRFIDDIIVVWEGLEESLEHFMREIIRNPYDITFIGQWHDQKVDYLDLAVFKGNEKLF